MLVARFVHITAEQSRYVLKRLHTYFCSSMWPRCPVHCTLNDFSSFLLWLHSVVFSVEVDTYYCYVVHDSCVFEHLSFDWTQINDREIKHNDTTYVSDALTLEWNCIEYFHSIFIHRVCVSPKKLRQRRRRWRRRQKRNIKTLTIRSRQVIVCKSHERQCNKMVNTLLLCTTELCSWLCGEPHTHTAHTRTPYASTREKKSDECKSMRNTRYLHPHPSVAAKRRRNKFTFDFKIATATASIWFRIGWSRVWDACGVEERQTIEWLMSSCCDHTMCRTHTIESINFWHFRQLNLLVPRITPSYSNPPHTTLVCVCVLHMLRMCTNVRLLLLVRRQWRQPRWPPKTDTSARWRRSTRFTTVFIIITTIHFSFFLSFSLFAFPLCFLFIINIAAVSIMQPSIAPNTLTFHININGTV